MDLSRAKKSSSSNVAANKFHLRVISRKPALAQEEIRDELFDALVAALIEFELFKTEAALGIPQERK